MQERDYRELSRGDSAALVLLRTTETDLRAVGCLICQGNPDGAVVAARRAQQKIDRLIAEALQPLAEGKTT